jgi:hypothetical protein
MQKGKRVFFELALLVSLLAGCADPITITPTPITPTPEENPDLQSFTIDIKVEKGNSLAESRSIAGPSWSHIKGGNIRNTLQISVADEAGNIVAFTEARKAGADETTATVMIDSLPLNKTYYFLTLMGYWEHDGNYNYKTDPPTLLAAGLTKEQMVMGLETITVTMWPISVDTKFTTTHSIVPADFREIEPIISAGTPDTVSLYRGEWNVTWTIKREGVPANGLTDLLAAQKVRFPNAGNLLVKSKKTILRGQSLGDDVQSYADVETGNAITLGLGRYASEKDRDQKTGSAAFNLEYVPFSVRAAGGTNPWTRFDDKSAFDLSGTNEPVWIIRNGLNDLDQTSATNFETFSQSGNTANANGAIVFKVKLASVNIVFPW